MAKAENVFPAPAAPLRARRILIVDFVAFLNMIYVAPVAMTGALERVNYTKVFKSRMLESLKYSRSASASLPLKNR